MLLRFMRVSPSFLDELRNRLSISSIISKRLSLIPKGRGEFAGVCPFHDDHAPSMTVTDVKGFYHCFACGAHGDIVKFIMEYHGMSFMEAVSELASDAGMEMPKPDREAEERYEKAKSLYDVMELATRYFQAQLGKPGGFIANEYIAKRGLQQNIIDIFRLGYATEARDGLKKALMERGIAEEQLIEAGLVIKPDNGRDSYDRFRGRLMFPIADMKGRVTAFGGRILGDGEPKYLNSPETPLFHKGKQLYNMNLARQPGYETGRIVVVEGYMDVIALYQAGFEYAVAPLGTALTEEQMQLLWRVVPEPIICMDGDSAGERAMHKTATLHLKNLQPGFSIKFAMLPEGQDPDDLIKSSGKKAISKVLDNAQLLVDILWNVAGGNNNSNQPEQKAAFEKRLMGFVDDIKDPTVQHYYRQNYRDKLWKYSRSYSKKSKSNASLAPTAAAIMHNEHNEIMQYIKTLILTAIHHATLLKNEEIIEDLLHLEINDTSISELRDFITSITLKSYSPEEIETSLEENNFSEIVNMLDLTTHDRFTHPSSDIALSQAGWNYIMAKYDLAMLEYEFDFATKGGKNITSDSLNALSEELIRMKRLVKENYIKYEEMLED